MFSAIVRPSTTSSSWYIVAMPSSSAASGVGMSTVSPCHAIVPLVGSVHAGERLDERRLARAVLAEHAVDLAGPNVQVDAAQRLHAGEALRDSAHVE